MKTMILITAFLITIGSSQAALSIKPGLWSVQSKMKQDGKEYDPQAILKATLAKMTPEQKKQMEAMMAKMGKGGSPFGVSSKGIEVCYTPEMLKSESFLSQQNSKECTQEFPVKTSTHIVIKFKCANGMNGTGDWTVKDSAHYVGTMKINEKSGKKTDVNYQAEFVSANCGNVKPIDLSNFKK